MTRPDLFNWQEQRAVNAIERDRCRLKMRIKKLPRFSHRRVELEARLRVLTEQALKIEGKLDELKTTNLH